jgi:hypothetical protein
MGNVSFDLPMPNQNFSYESLLKAEIIDSNFVVLIEWFDLDSGNQNQGVATFLMKKNGDILWFKKEANPLAPTSISWNNDSQILLSHSYESSDGMTAQVCFQGHEKSGNQIFNECILNTSAIEPYYASTGVCFSGIDSNFYSVSVEYVGVDFFTGLSKINKNGEIIWKKIIKEGTFGPSFRSYFNGGKVDTDGSVLLCGTVADPTQPQWDTKQYIWVFKLSPDGCFNNDCGDTILIHSELVATDNLEQKTADFKPFRVFPNPISSDKLFINYENEKFKNIYISIIDLNGKIFFQKEFEHIFTEVDLPDLTKGIYFLQIFNETGLLQVEKLIK